MADRDSEILLEEAVSSHGRMVYNVCLRLLEHSADAEDATQAVFLIWKKKGHRFTDAAQMAAWLYKTSVFVARMHRRAIVRRKVIEARASEVKNPMSTAVDEAKWGAIKTEVDLAVSALPLNLRAPIVLTFFQGLTRAGRQGCGDFRARTLCKA